MAPGGFVSQNDNFPDTMGIKNWLKRKMRHAFASNISNTQVALGSLGIRIVNSRIVRRIITDLDAFTSRLVAER